MVKTKITGWHHRKIYFAGYKGTPAAKERTGPKIVKTTEIPRSPIIFNEIANRDDDKKTYEWIELRNVSDGEFQPQKLAN